MSIIIAYKYQHCRHNGIPLSAHFMSWNFDFILYWPEDGYIHPKHVAKLTINTSNCHFMTNCCVCRLNVILLDWYNTTGWLSLNNVPLLWGLLHNSDIPLHSIQIRLRPWSSWYVWVLNAALAFYLLQKKIPVSYSRKWLFKYKKHILVLVDVLV
jgi:hypothetical protein